MRLRVGLVAALGLLLIAGCGVRAQDEPHRLPNPESTPKPVPTLKASVCPPARPSPSVTVAEPSAGPTSTSTGAGACSTAGTTS